MESVLIVPANARAAAFQREQRLIRCQWSCRMAGVRFKGVQSGFGVVPDLCLFEHTPGRTLALPIDSLTPFQIKWRAIESEREFAAGERAA